MAAPLCPAGHLPYRWGDHKWLDLLDPRPFRRAATPIVWGNGCAQPISPLVGEMPGRCPTRIDR
ncbi:hypothetical protein GFL39_36410 [Rhizobium leguminosarum bv. viciae]|nr:hypothetical protein [Rhizobium leguminosarum bv. viciae]NKL87996.1 hypothetical protein [Rhizobium leguminosarum bv. viciae]NKL95352.1 hypothetical protein [Rhizobium leguminosarum bv. viciae]NKM96393.1 hypothetical protein [Rhizobium leguminosarum bv. viciae]